MMSPKTVISSAVRAAAVAFVLCAGLAPTQAFAAGRTPENPTGTQPGLYYQFYLSSGSGGVLPDFTQLTPSKSGSVTNFDISPRTRDTDFSFQFMGYVTVPTAGNWTFYTSSDDGSRLYIGNTLVVENNYSQGQTERSGIINLLAGTHAVTVQFGQGAGGFGLTVSYAGPGTAKQLIPNSALSYLTPTSAPVISATNSNIVPSTVTITDSTAGSTIHYTIDGSTPSGTHGTTYSGSFVISSPCTLQAIATTPGYADSSISRAVFFVPLPAETPAGTVQGVKYKFYTTSGGGGVLPDFTTITPAKTGSIRNFLLDPRTTDTNISFEYTGYVTVLNTGMWTFFTTSDDGSRLFIGPSSTLVVDNNYSQGMTERSGTIALAAGKHAIKVQWGQGGGGYGLEVRYQGPTGSGVSKQQIPDSALAYIPLAATPVISCNGTPVSSLTVKMPNPTFTMSLSCATPNSTIYYTTNGQPPTTSSTVYSAPVVLTIPVTVEAMATAPNYDTSVIAVANFVTSLPPANDNFANAIALSGTLPITVTGTNLNATWESGEPNHGDGGGLKSIWYSWLAPVSGTYMLSTADSTAADGGAMDTTLAVYTGSAVNALTLLSQDDDASTSTKTSVVVFTATAGTTYRIAVDGFDGVEGNVKLKLSQGPVLSVVATTPNASETGPVNGVFTISRPQGTTSGDLLVHFALGGTAIEGRRYVRYEVHDSVTLYNGSASAQYVIQVIDDIYVEGSQTVTLTLLPDPLYAINPAQAMATVTIADNDTGTGTVSDLHWSVKRGFYSAAIDVAITTDTADASIRYTTDGSCPTQTPLNGTLYTGPIHITGTTVLRAVGYKTGMSPTLAETQTYIYTADVINQSYNAAMLAGWPSTWGGNVVDYGMDPNIVTVSPWNAMINPALGGTALTSIRALCLTMKRADLFDSSTGIYANPGGDGYTWERPGEVEFLDPAGPANNWGELCGVRIRGGYSRSTGNPKHAFRIFFKKQYDKGSLSEPLFGPLPAQQKIDKFDIRCDMNYSWSFDHNKGQECFIRDNWTRDTQLAMSGTGSRGDYFHLFINGQYWGLFNTDERCEASFSANYFGGDKDDYDTIKTSGDTGYNIYATDGNLEAWTRLWKQCKAGLSSNAAYFKIQGRNPDGTVNPGYENLLELDQMIDYMLVMYYGGNLDAPISNFLGNASPNNIFATRNRTGQYGGFRFFAHDSEHTLLNVNENRLGPYSAGDTLEKSNPQWVFQQCMANSEFRLRVADHIRKHFFNNGALTPAPCAARFQTRMNQLNTAVVGESARWGDSGGMSPAANRNDWLSVCNGILNNYFPYRTQIVLNQLIAAGLYPSSLSAPTFNQYGGNINPGFVCNVSNPNASGRVYYTKDGSDARAIGGGIASTAVAGSTTTTGVVLSGAGTLQARVLNGSTWSAMTSATFTSAQDFSTLKVTELMYNPPDGQEFEFLELKNTGSVALDLSGATFTSAISYTFPADSVMNAGQFIVLAADAPSLAAKYPGVTAYGQYSGHFSNSGDTLTLTYPTGATILSFTYGVAPPWPPTAAGFGFSLVPADASAPADYGNATYWRASTNAGGSPGADDPAPPSTYGSIRINEALTYATLPTHEYIELCNTGSSTVDISGWYLTDDPAVPQKYCIPNGTTLGAGVYVSFSDTQYGASFGLSSHGEEVYVFAADPVSHVLTGYWHGFSFGAAETGVSFGRYVISSGAEQFVAQLSPSPGEQNSPPQVGPVVLNEVMYQPTGTGDQFIELKNITPSDVNLWDPSTPTNTWKIIGTNFSFSFPQNSTIPANGLAVVCGMSDPNSNNPGSFRTKYNVPPGVTVYGPWTGTLNTAGMHLELQKPVAPDYIVVEALDYTNTAPWPQEPAGNGPSLVRIHTDLATPLLTFGNDPINWRKSVANGGTPGRIDMLVPLAPSDLSATAQSSTVIKASWSDSATNETSYTVQRSPDGVSNWTALLPLGADVTFYQDFGLSPATKYYYRVYCSNASGDSAFSDVADATTMDPPPPNQLQNIYVLPYSQTKLTVGWYNTGGGATDIKIERSSDGQTGWVQIAQVPVNTADIQEYLDTGLQPTTRYYYRVRASSTWGNSDYGDVADGLTLQDRFLRFRPAPSLLRGHTGSIFVDLDSGGGENTVAFSLAFDSLVLSNPVAVLGADSGAGVTLSQQTAAGAVGATLSWGEVGCYGAGVKTIAEIRFAVASPGPATSTPVTFTDQPVTRATSDVNLVALETNYQDATANIVPNTAPVASNGTLALVKNTPQSGMLVASDADGDALTFSIVGNAKKGVVAIDDASTGAYTYTPSADAYGSDSFTFKANDGMANSNVATVSVTIQPGPATQGPPLQVLVQFTIPKSIFVAWGAGTTGKQPGDVTALDWTVRNSAGNRIYLGQTCSSNDANNNIVIKVQNTSKTSTNARISAAVTGSGGWIIGGTPAVDTIVLQAQLGTNALATLAAAAQELTDTTKLANGADQALVVTVKTPTSITNNEGVEKTISVGLTASPE